MKALREGRANIAESYAAVEGREIILVNANIPEYGPANRFNHEPRRPRKLLLHRKQIDKLIGAVQREGRTLIPTRLYFNDRGMVKLELALAKGKKAHDKRAEAERDWKREQGRLMRERLERCERTGSSTCSSALARSFLDRGVLAALLPHRAARL